MTKRTYVVAYEGDAHSSTVLDYAVQHALEASGTLNIVHVLEWSPFQFLTPEEIEERAGKRKEGWSARKRSS
ncbi:universal stress protein [Palleronia pontilimi]|uniref:universal stress protein n=1 Tax=Palleronia pontilimi TaxID=1964209 RepID=UPI001F2BC239|nr:universal stress protein [Palleronia pontilimi]